jgi:hypothetical protein
MIITRPLSCDLCTVGYHDAQSYYRETWGVYAQTLIVPVEDLSFAYHLATEEKIFATIVAVPGFPKHSWMLVGQHGIFYSEGG